MKVTILGSGCGIPNLKRSSPAILIESKGLRFLLDCGPGTFRQLLNLKIDYRDIDKILLTHFHTDHINDIAIILFAANYQLKPRKKDLELIGPKGLKRFYENLLKLYGNKVLPPQEYKILINEKTNSTFKLKDFLITTKKLKHAKESMGYRIKTPKGKILVYSGDTDYCKNLFELTKDADLLILECSFEDNIKAPGHLTPKLAAEIANISRVKSLILTHLYPIARAQEISKSVKKIYKGNFQVARDFLSINI